MEMLMRSGDLIRDKYHVWISQTADGKIDVFYFSDFALLRN